MASKRIAGITIELNGDVTGLNRALKGVDTQLKTTKTNLKDVEKLLEFDPENVELLEQKQKLLADAVSETKDRLDILKDALTNDLPPDQYDALQREIIATQQELDTYQSELEEANGAQGDLADGAGDAAGEVNELGKETSETAEETGEANQGWSVARQVLADLVSKGIDLAIAGLKKLGEAFGEAVTSSSEFADEIMTLSVTSGLSTETLQEYAYMAELIDVDLDTVVSSMTKLEKAMASASSGTGDAYDAFHDLGVEFQNVDGTYRDVEDVFLDLIDALGGITDEVELDTTAMELFGRGAKDLKPMIKAGTDGIKSFKQEAHDMGAVLSEDALQSLTDMDDGFQRLDKSSQVLQQQLALALAPAVTTLLEELLKMTQDESWQEVFSQIGEVAKDLVPVLADISGLLAPIFEALSPVMDILTSILQTLAPVIATLLEPLAELLGIILDPVAQLVDALLPALVALVDAFSAVLEPVNAVIQTTMDMLMPIINAIMPVITESLIGLADEISTGLVPAVEGFNQLLEGDFMGALETWWGGIEDTWELLNKFSDKVKPLFSDMFTALGGYLDDYAAKLKTGFTDAFSAAKTVIENAIETIKGILSGDLDFPHINLPHFSISGSFSLNPLSVPKISVDWYAKAMEDGMILNSPTIFGAMNGNLLGGGEAGAEAVVGVKSLMAMIQSAVNNAPTTNLGGVTIVVNAAEGQSVNAIAEAVEERINAKYLRKVAVQR